MQLRAAVSSPSTTFERSRHLHGGMREDITGQDNLEVGSSDTIDCAVPKIGDKERVIISFLGTL